MREAQQLIADAWLLYQDEMISEETPQAQRRDLRRAFYGGVKCALDILHHLKIV